MKEQLIQLFGNEWYSLLKEYLHSKEFLQIGTTINELRKQREVFPEKELVFKSFKQTNPNTIKVIILVNQPMDKWYCGLPICGCNSFYTHKILKSWNDELISEYPELENRFLVNGSLDWQDLNYLVEQDILFLNTQLTDDARLQFQHELLWKPFIKQVILSLKEEQGLIWCLIGVITWEYEKLINSNSKVIKTPYITLPEFKGCGLFRKINFELNRLGKTEINW